ncbi:MAG: ABC transporter permease [Acidobacteriota bacterium]|jgi:predicted permease
MTGIVNDLRLALRTLWKTPRLTVAVVLSLALGIGANSAVFTMVKALFLNPSQVEDAPRLAAVFTTDSQMGSVAIYGDQLPVSFPNYEDFRDRNQAFSGLAAYQTMFVSLSQGDRPERIIGEIASGNYFQVLGVDAAIGRTFTPAEDEDKGAHPVTVLSHDFWEKRFGADPSILGRTVRLNNHPFTVIGVAERGFDGLSTISTPSLWVPIAMRDAVLTGPYGTYFENRRAVSLNVVGRLRDGVDRARAEDMMQGIAAQLEEEFPRANNARSIELSPLNEVNMPAQWRESFRIAGLLLGTIVGLVLFIACANVANLLLARAVARRREIGIRLSLGAGRGALFRQLMTESLVLALLGGAVGLAIAAWGPRIIWANRPPELAQATLAFGLDVEVLVFTLALALLTGLLFGLAPAIQATKPRVVETIKEGNTGTEGRGRRIKLSDLLVVAQVTLSVVALVGSGLFIASLSKARDIDPGFQTSHLATISFDPATQGYGEARGEQLYRQVVERASRVPGVESVALGTHIPLSLTGIAMRSVIPPGEDPADQSAAIIAVTNTVGEGFFDTMGIPLLEGRTFTTADREDGRRVAVVNRALADRAVPDGSALGRELQLRGGDAPVEIVGVVENSKAVRISEPSQPQLFMPWRQNYPNSITTLFVRTAGDPGVGLGPVRREVQAVDPTLALTNVWEFSRVLGQALWALELGTIILGFFGVLAVVLTLVGIYGVVSHAANRRRREMGVRLALGAARGDVLRMIIRRGMVPVSIGIVLGLVGSFFLARGVESLLYGVAPSDPVTYLVIAAILVMVGFAANLLPARSASREDPVIVLKAE